MRKLLALLLILGSAALGLYVGLYLCLYGGIVQIVAALQLSPVPGSQIAFGILRIVGAGVCGGLSFTLPSMLGLSFLIATKPKADRFRSRSVKAR